MSQRVLIADSDEALLVIYREYLRQDGFRVATAASGLECIARLRDFQPHLLILELDLPWGRGEGVLARTAEESDLPRVPVIVLSVRREVEAPLLRRTFPIHERHLNPVAPAALAYRVRCCFQDTARDHFATAAS
jgi:DNA-binding response OmpR family regulator